MSKQFSRSHRRAKEKSGHRNRNLAIFMALVLTVSGAVTYMTWSHGSDTRQAFSERASTWWAERKARIATKVAESKQNISKPIVASKAKSSAPEPLHFEFYNMLPNSNASVAAVTTESPSIFNHDNLEREFAKTVEKTSYVIQTGIYSNATSADKTRESLVEEGLAVKVVKAYIDERLVYRIQVGPYQEKDQINEAQSKLAARGIHGVLRKTEEKFA